MTILKVEPLAQGETYKFVKAYFSSALTSLSPSEIEIRGKKDQKLYSIQTATLSTDGMAADLTLYGNAGDDGTTYLYPNTTYVMTLTQNGQSTSLEFELPAYATDKIVTSVDMDKNTITTDWSDRTGQTGAAGTFNVAGKFDGNLGSLIGRTVNYQYDTDNNLTAFSLDDAEVIYGAMKFVNDTGDIRKAYFKDALTGETYKVNRTTKTASKNFTWFYAANDGKDMEDPENGTDFKYTKLVLNPDGTVSTANLVPNFAQNLFVTDVDGTKVIQDKNNAFDLDGYTIVKDDAYVSPDDLEFGDVVFINTALKFADVYNNEISGELSNVISGKLDIDEKTYDGNGAQYYDDDDEVYKTLSTGTKESDASSQTYLNSLDTETDTTIWIARDGKIKYLDGTVVGQKKYTYTTYLVTKTAQPYTESLKDKFNVDVFDGATTSTLTFDLSSLKFYKGVAGKYSATDGDSDPDTDYWGDISKTTSYGIFTFKGDKNGEYDAANYKIQAGAKGSLVRGSLVKFMFDEDGVIVGFSDNENAGKTVKAESSLDGTHALNDASAPNLKAGSTKLVQDKDNQDTMVYTMGSFTNLWIVNENGADDPKYSKVVLTDFDNEIETNDAAFTSLTYRVDGTKVTDLVATIASNDAYEDAEYNYPNGILAGVTFKNDETDTAQIMSKITIYGTDGVKTTYTVNKDAQYPDLDTAEKAKALAGAYVNLEQNKATDEIAKVTVTAAGAKWKQETGTKTDSLVANHATANFHNDKLILATGNKELTTTSDGVIMKRYKKEGSWKYEVVDYTDVNVHDGNVNVWYNTTNVSKTGDKIQSDMIVVELLAKAVTPVANLITITATAGINTVAKTVSTKTGNTLKATFGGAEEIAEIQWYLNNTAVDGATKVKASLADLGNPDANDKVFVRMTGTEGTIYNSDVYTFKDPEFATATFNQATTSLNWNSTNVRDQFGESFTLATVATTTIATDSTAKLTATMTTVGDGTATITFSYAGTGAMGARATSATAVAFGSELKIDWVNENITDITALTGADISAVTVSAQ